VEVTGIAHWPEVCRFVAVGWDRAISYYSDDAVRDPTGLGADHPDVAKSRVARAHETDVSCCAVNHPLLCTAGYNGDITVWKDTGRAGRIKFRTVGYETYRALGRPAPPLSAQAVECMLFVPPRPVRPPPNCRPPI
jgi:hypothetical protein